MPSSPSFKLSHVVCFSISRGSIARAHWKADESLDCVQTVLGPQPIVETWHGRAERRRSLLARQQALLDREMDLAATFALEFWTSQAGTPLLGVQSNLSIMTSLVAIRTGTYLSL